MKIDPHFQYETLLDHAARTQHPVLRSLVTAHLATCPACCEAMLDIHRIALALWEEEPSLPVSEKGRRRAVAESRIRRPRSTPARGRASSGEPGDSR